MLQKVKLMLEIDPQDTSKDELLKLMLEDATTEVLNYCRIKTLPAELEGFVRTKVTERFKAREVDGVEKVKRGDTEVTYAENTAGANGFTAEDKASLNRFRRFLMR